LIFVTLHPLTGDGTSAGRLGVTISLSRGRLFPSVLTAITLNLYSVSVINPVHTYEKILASTEPTLNHLPEDTSQTSIMYPSKATPPVYLGGLHAIVALSWNTFRISSGPIGLPGNSHGLLIRTGSLVAAGGPCPTEFTAETLK